MTNQAGWQCENCRAKGLDRQRGCRWGGYESAKRGKPVWIRGEHHTLECPKPLISASSLSWLELYVAWKQSPVDLMCWPARDAEAVLVLESEMRREIADGESD
jgi:hypothetical protein